MVGINPDGGLSQTKYYPRGQTGKIKSEAFPPGFPSDNADICRQLTENRFIREVKYPEWLANVVVVPKKGGKW